MNGANKVGHWVQHGAKIIVVLEWEQPICWSIAASDQPGGEKMGEVRKVIIDGEEFEVEVEVDGENYRATIEGRTFEFTIPEAKGSAPRKRGSGGGRKRSGTVSASMPGKVVTVEVSVGDSVEEGQTILILEAMKMQNEVAAPITGTVSEVHCEDGMNVEANVPLVVITPSVQDED
jgi:biotin carboxyl carrier protein